MEMTRTVVINAKLVSHTIKVLTKVEDKYKELPLYLINALLIDKKIKNFITESLAF